MPLISVEAAMFFCHRKTMMFSSRIATMLPKLVAVIMSVLTSTVRFTHSDKR